MPTALITGITGQDGTYLAEHLQSLGYRVHGLIRGQANPKRQLIEALLPEVQIVEGDLLDQTSLINAIQMIQPSALSPSPGTSRSSPVRSLAWECCACSRRYA
jgi:GDPmannose 4,6-dehydratase